MNDMKKTGLTIIAFFVMFTACEDYLEFPPEAELPQDEFFKTAQDAEMSVNAMYGFLRSWDISAFNHLILSSLPTDNIIKGSEPGDGAWALSFQAYEYTVNNNQIRAFFDSRYEGINLSNQVLTNVPDISMDERVKKRYLAEARFMRAFHYFHLVRAFGGVPIVKEVPVGPEGNVRKSAEQTWDFIQTELEKVVESGDLPDNIPTTELGRAPSWAAKALLAKVYMYRENWPECKTMTDDIINNGPYDLYPDFYDLFRLEQEHCIESIFEIQATQVPGENDLSNSQFAQIQGVRGQFGWGWFAPTDDLADAYDNAGDSVRKEATIFYRGYITREGDTIQGIEQMAGANPPRYMGKAYVPSSVERVSGPPGCDQNARLIRFAEVLLMNAEAAYHTGGDAATPLNRVRARADLDPIGDPSLEDIWLERRLELAGEQDRFWDVVRQGRGPDVFGRYGFVENKHELYPIPQAEIDLSGGLLDQNTGWQ